MRSGPLSALAVLGEDATLSATGALTGLSYLDAADRRGQLVTAGVLAAHDPPRSAQPLLLHAIYDTIAPRERLRLHREAAHALVGSGAPIDAIARHLLAAAPARDPWAARTLQTAARAARARGAIMEACGYLQRGVAEGVDELQYELERELGLAEATLGDPGAGDRLQRAYGLAGSARARAQIGLALARLSASIGATSRAREWCLTALAQLHSSEDVELSARLHAELIAASTAEPEAPSPAELLRAEHPPDGDPSGCLMIALEADSAVAAGRSHAAAVALARRALSSPRVWRERGSLIPHLAVEVLVTAEHLVEAKAHWDAGLAATDSLGLTWDAAAIRAHRAGTLLRLGAVDAAIDDAQAALDTVGDGTGPVRACAAATLAEALLELGRVDAAAAALDDVRGRPAPFDARIVRASARILIWQRRHADALAELDMAAQTSTANPMLIPWRSLAAECHVALG